MYQPRVLEDTLLLCLSSLHRPDFFDVLFVAIASTEYSMETRYP
jgi:hypothetical protein